MSRPNKVLAVTTRTADMCATQALLYAAGYELITATNVPTARAMIRSLPICGLIMCPHSWSESERDSVTAELLKFGMPTMPCPGCTGCDEARGKAGTLSDIVPLNGLIEKFRKTPR